MKLVLPCHFCRSWEGKYANIELQTVSPLVYPFGSSAQLTFYMSLEVDYEKLN